MPVQRLWPLISDTERMNRASGLAPVQYRTQASLVGPANVFAESKFGPLKMRWQEFPFEWVQQDHFFVLRRFDKGPFKEIRPGMIFSGSNGVTDVRVFLEAEPRNAFGKWIARYVMWPGVLRKFQSILRGMEAYLLNKAPDPFWKTTPKGPIDSARLNALAQRLIQRGAANDLMKLLTAFIVEAPDLDVSAMRPFALADRWDKDRLQVLKMFLMATQEGLLDLSWEVLCPNCRKSKVSNGSLQGLTGQAHCEYCQIKFDAEFDRSVEARFGVNTSVRKVQRNEFCAGGPANTPHVLAQVLVKPGETRSISLNALGAPLKVRSPQIQSFSRVRVLDMASAGECAIKLKDGVITPASAEVKVGNAVFTLRNDSAEERWFVIERETWDEAVATAAQVTSLQDFRDMFSSEVLAPGEDIAVRSLTFMFTDLAGSTATYHDLGDAKAYSMVRDHFVVLKEAIAKREGAVVKTIGDAVMAVFYAPKQALLAALDMQRGIRDWNASRNNANPIVLKVGLHEGPAIAVNADDVLDYFGTSVNLAARVEGLSIGGDIVLSDGVMQGLGDDKMLHEFSAKREMLEAAVKGFPQPVKAWRIWPKLQ